MTLTATKPKTNPLFPKLKKIYDYMWEREASETVEALAKTVVKKIRDLESRVSKDILALIHQNRKRERDLGFIALMIFLSHGEHNDH